MNRIYAPLMWDHPLIGKICGICDKKFFPSERITLLCVDCDEVSTVQGCPVHASCAYKGVKTPKGIIERIKDGDGSPFPVIMEEGEQYKFEEIGLEGI